MIEQSAAVGPLLPIYCPPGVPFAVQQDVRMLRVSEAIEQATLKHLNTFFGKMLICDIRGENVARYQASRHQATVPPPKLSIWKSVPLGQSCARIASGASRR